MKYYLKSIKEYDNISKGDLVKILGIPFDHRIRAYDYALPQDWLNKFNTSEECGDLKNEYEIVRSGTIWVYAGGECSFGFPFPITQEAFEILRVNNELSDYCKAMIQPDIFKVTKIIVGYDCSAEVNIQELAKSLNSAQYTRICRIAGIPVDEIGYAIKDRVNVLKGITLLGDSIPNGTKKESEVSK